MSELILLYGHPVGPLTIHMLLFTPLRLVLVLQYLISPSFTGVNTLVSRHHKSFVVHLLEPHMQFFTCDTTKQFQEFVMSQCNFMKLCCRCTSNILHGMACADNATTSEKLYKN